MSLLVSIIIPVYNGENFLEEAIESALAQTYKNIEVIVVDDGSTDLTEVIANKFKNKVKYFKKVNGGVSSALNYGISKMSGEFFSWLSHDDLYTKNKIKDQMNLVNQYKNIDIIYAKSSLINTEGKIIKKTLRDSNKFKKISPYMFYIKNNFKVPNGCSFLINKQVFKKVGEFDESLRYNQDADYWKRIGLYNTNIIFLSKTIVKTRIHDKQSTILLSEALINNIKTSIMNRTTLIKKLNKINYYKWLYYESYRIKDKKFKKDLYKTIEENNRRVKIYKIPLLILGAITFKMREIRRKLLDKKHREKQR